MSSGFVGLCFTTAVDVVDVTMSEELAFSALVVFPLALPSGGPVTLLLNLSGLEDMSAARHVNIERGNVEVQCCKRN